MNRNWPSHWKKTLPKFLGEDFFASFENIASENSGASVNIYESSNEVLCVFAIPGLKLDEVDIYAYERTLEVRGTIHFDFNGFRLIQEEIPQGPIKRTIELPFPVRDDKVDASYFRGTLIIHLHRLIRPEHARNKIQIKNLEE